MARLYLSNIDNPQESPFTDADNISQPAFPHMAEPYDRRLQQLAVAAAIALGGRRNRGVYVAWTGPALDTRAEYRMLRAMGADVVGMSTVPEVIVARHMGMPVLGLSIITDECFPDALQIAVLSEIIANAVQAEPDLTRRVPRCAAPL